MVSTWASTDLNLKEAYARARWQDCLLFTSRIEAWAMPVLEAMASGIAVVTTPCFGIDDYAQVREGSLPSSPAMGSKREGTSRVDRTLDASLKWSFSLNAAWIQLHGGFPTVAESFGPARDKHPHG